MQVGDLVAFHTDGGTSPIEGMLGVLLDDVFKDGHGYENVQVYFANAPRWPKRTIMVKWLRMVNASR